MTNNRTAPQSIAVATHSPRWQSQIQRSVEQLSQPPKVHWLPDFASARQFIIANDCELIVAELPASFSQQPDAALELTTSLCNNPHHCPLFLLGDDSVDPWRAVLAEAGASETCCSILDYVKAWPRIVRHLKNCPSQELTVEETVAARLPW